MTDQDELMLRVAALKVLSDFTKAEYDGARAEAAKVMTPGDRRQVRSPLDGSKIGPVSMSDPKSMSVVTDEPALTEWMTERYPEHVESGYKIIGSDPEVMSVLFAHAPHLLRRTQRVRRDVLMQLHADAVRLGTPVGPGGEVDMPGVEIQEREPVVSCRPDPETALLAVMELVHNRHMFIDGTRAELEVGE
jgi:hypothetical protein